MDRYVISAVRHKTKDASSKPKEDINKILKSNYAFKSIFIDNNFFNRSLYINKEINNKFKNLKKGDIVLVQYPLYMGKKFEKKLISFFHKKEVISIALIHDIDTLRYMKLITEFNNVKEEASYLNNFDYVISPNNAMTLKLFKSGLTIPVENINIFDYVQNIKHHPNSSKYKDLVTFAGNLNKSKFINNISLTSPITINLYGNLLNKTKYDKHINYKGTFTSSELTTHLGKGFGLVWDGKDSTSINGKLGEYLKYNNPYKTSLYLSVGMPVIIWSKAAMASFVKKHHVGVVIDNLNDLSKITNEITNEDFNEMCRNVRKIAPNLRNGFYTQRVMDKVLKRVFTNKI